MNCCSHYYNLVGTIHTEFGCHIGMYLWIRIIVIKTIILYYTDYTLVCSIDTVFGCHRKTLSIKLNSFSTKQKSILVFQSFIYIYMQVLKFVF